MKNFLCDVFFSAESAKNFAKAAELFGCYYGMMEQMMNFLCVNFSLCLLFSAIFFTAEDAETFAEIAEFFGSN